jgi:hypothetical protein
MLQKLHMFCMQNRVQKSFNGEENKEVALDWDSPKVLVWE